MQPQVLYKRCSLLKSLQLQGQQYNIVVFALEYTLNCCLLLFFESILNFLCVGVVDNDNGSVRMTGKTLKLPV